MRSLAFYGKGGIGKSTVASNLAALFARGGARTLLVGCDPKHDSCYKLVDRSQVRTVLDLLRDDPSAVPTREQFVMRGRMGVDCIETGGPEPGVGCAGRGITRMFETLAAVGLTREEYEVWVFDVLGDVVCGGFAAPLRSGFADEVYVVASGEVMALYAANNICRAVARYARNGARLGGVVPNLRGLPDEATVLRAFAERLGAPLLPPLARRPDIQAAERAARTVIEHAPDSTAARDMEALYAFLVDPARPAAVVPRPMDDAGFDQFLEAFRIN